MAQTTATPARPRARTRARTGANVKVTPADITAIADDVTTNVLVERKHEMRVMVLGSLAGVNIHQLGPPGSAKSLGLREYCKRISGARYFEKAVHAQMPADALIGGYDMPNFAKTGEFARNVEHYLPNAHVGNIDEATRANGPTTDALLPMMNTEERQYEANGGMKKSPLLFLVTASNFMPEPDDAHMGAFVDRLTLMQYIDYVKAPESFQEMFRRHHDRRLREYDERDERKGADNTYTPATITLEQFQAAQALVRQVVPTKDFLDAFYELRVNAKAKGLAVSDRRWMELGRVCRANAWLAGRDRLLDEDLAVLEAGLWRRLTERPAATELTLAYKGKYEREAEEKLKEAAPHMAEHERIKPLVEDVPPNEEIPQDLLTRAINCGRGIDSVKGRVDKVVKDAERDQRDASKLKDLQRELLAIQEWFLRMKLPSALGR